MLQSDRPKCKTSEMTSLAAGLHLHSFREKQFDMPLAVPVMLGNVVPEAHEIMNCSGTKLTTSIPGLTVQQESASATEKLSPAIFHLSPMLNKASGSLLFSLGWLETCLL